ncbi:MAG: serine/threonine-protein phosphatase [Pseudomonadota bacterium]|nr:serine/threonine-protein phosphatase [Pseudomonadota bacterium]
MPLQIETAVLHSTGGRANNEDAWGEMACDGTACWVVCDGAGGHGGGDVASRLAVQHSLVCWRDKIGCAASAPAPPRVRPPLPDQDADALHEAVIAADRAVHDGQRQGAAVADMRTTIAMLALDLNKRHAAWAHVGDTRVYRFRSGRLCEQTRDHSLVEQLRQAGLAQGDASREHPRRNVLTAALGGGYADESAETAAMAEPLQAGDAFLLCTDGFWEYVFEDEMAAELAGLPAAAQVLARLEDRLRARARSGHDNYTAVLIELREAAA